MPQDTYTPATTGVWGTTCCWHMQLLCSASGASCLMGASVSMPTQTTQSPSRTRRRTRCAPWAWWQLSTLHRGRKASSGIPHRLTRQGLLHILGRHRRALSCHTGPEWLPFQGKLADPKHGRLQPASLLPPATHQLVLCPCPQDAAERRLEFMCARFSDPIFLGESPGMQKQLHLAPGCFTVCCI